MLRAPGFAGSPGRRVRFGRLWLALAGLALLLLTGCQAGLEVDVDVRADGGGEVRATVVLDEDAAAQVSDLGQDLQVDDLEAAGWSIEGPSQREDGEVRVEAVKSFVNSAGAERAVQELGGPEGPFRDFRFRLERSFLETRTSMSGTVDLTAGLEGFSDDVLRQRLGSPLGVDLATVERQTGRPLRDSFRVQVAVNLPGGKPTVITPALGQREELAAEARRWNRERVAFAALSVVSGLVLVVVLLRRTPIAS